MPVEPSRAFVDLSAAQFDSVDDSVLVSIGPFASCESVALRAGESVCHLLFNLLSPFCLLSSSPSIGSPGCQLRFPSIHLVGSGRVPQFNRPKNGIAASVGKRLKKAGGGNSFRCVRNTFCWGRALTLCRCAHAQYSFASSAAASVGNGDCPEAIDPRDSSSIIPMRVVMLLSVVYRLRVPASSRHPLSRRFL